MRTWWIVTNGYDPIIAEAHEGSWLIRLFRKAGIGPFWSHVEAQRVLEHWTK